MKIVELNLATSEFDAQMFFYTSVLGLPLTEETGQSFSVQAGQTRLTFQATEQKDLLYHFAFTIPRNTFPQAKQWLQERVPLLKEGGQDEFTGSLWAGRSVYFRDVANNILEFIAHDEIDTEAPEPELFGAQDILMACEIGVVTDDVPAQATALKEYVGHNNYQEKGSDTFAPVGDVEGRFIVVKRGRHWFPTTTASVVAPLRVVIEGKGKKEYKNSEFPYRVQMSRKGM